MTPFPSAAIFDSSLSTQITFMPRSARAAPVTSPTYPVPTMQMFMIYGLSRREAPPQELPLPRGRGGGVRGDLVARSSDGRSHAVLFRFRYHSTLLLNPSSSGTR